VKVFRITLKIKELKKLYLLLLEPDENGLVGVLLTSEIKLSEIGLDFVPSSVFGSVIKVKDYRVDWYVAPIAALTEGYKIAKATVIGFSSTVYGIITNFTVSEQVGGPVQVAKLSYQFVDKGGIDLLNFIALISLSLAVINLLPIPALDGGRLVFVLIEALRGKPVNQKTEAIIHTVGFMLLMGLILIITFFDIIRL
jgi:regulator of sigma E protease